MLRNLFTRAAAWRLVAVVVAALYAAPIASTAYDALLRTNVDARERLIRQHRLWEVEADFRGKPEVWARFAARLLNERQVLRRLAIKYGAESQAIETEFRRDLAIARAEVVLGALALWALPLALLYAGVRLWRRRRRDPPAKVQPASASDPRYRPPEAH